MLSPDTWLYLIITIIVLSFIFGKFLDFLNYKSQIEELPDEFRDIYDEAKYRKSIDYHKTLNRFSFITETFSFLLILIVLFSGFLGEIDAFLRSHFDSEMVIMLLFFAILYFASDFLSIPFQLYNTFVIEEKFGFNKTTAKTFIIDKLKGYLLSIIFGGALLAILVYLILLLGQTFWLYFWIVISVVILLLNMFYTSWIVPLFNKLSPLEEGDLKAAILNYAQGVNFPLDNIYVIDGSKRSSKANAFFSGIGKKKKIVLYDTLIENHTQDELVAVLAHEVGHYKKKHLVTGLILSVLQVGLMLFLLSLFVFDLNLSLGLGANQPAIHINLFAFGILYSPISGIISLMMNLISRKNEFEADAFAAKTYDGNALINALKKLSANNLSNLFPHPWYVFFHYSHPPLIERISAIKNH
jgi:STE24 endopeptidase